MRLLDALERRIGFLAVPHLTWAIAVGQAMVYFVGYAHPDLLPQLVLVPALVLEGEWWRVFTFVFAVGRMNPLFFLLGLLFFWFMGTALENTWGAFRYNVFLFVGWVATVAASFLMPEQFVSPIFLVGSVFLAFATLFPNYVIYLFFILPIQVKWLALLAWIGFAWSFFRGSGAVKITIAAALLNYFLFFWRDIVRNLRHGAKKAGKTAAKKAGISGRQPFHRCAVCGKTDVSHPELDFRYCPQCAGGLGYCPEHIHDHEHVTADAPRAN